MTAREGGGRGPRRPLRWNNAMATYAAQAVFASLLAGGFSNAASKLPVGCTLGLALGCLTRFCLEARAAASDQSVDAGREG